MCKNIQSRIPYKKTGDSPVFYSNTEKFVPKINKGYVPHTQSSQIFKAIDDPDNHLIMIYGFGGIGKTALISEYCKAFEDTNQNIAYFDLTNVPSFEEIAILILSNIYEDTTDYNIRSEYMLIEQIRQHIKEKSVILIFDNLESIMKSGTGCGEIMNNFRGYESLFKLFKDYNNSSTIILVGREKFTFMPNGEEGLYIEQLNGLNGEQTQSLLINFNLSGNFDELSKKFSGNPLALKLASVYIEEDFNSNINDFLDSSEVPIEVYKLLDQHFDRLDEIGKIILLLLAVERDSMTKDSIYDKIVKIPISNKSSQPFKHLQNRCLIETSIENKSENSYFLQGIILEYLSEYIVKTLVNEICNCNPYYINLIPLINTTSKEYNIESQKRVLIAPIFDAILDAEGKPSLTKKLKNIISKIEFIRSYAIGNIINILSQFETIISDYDFEEKYIINADLRYVSLNNIKFDKSYFEGVLWRNTFGILIDVKFTHDDKFIIGGSTAFNIHMWNAENLKFECEIKGHTDWVRSVDSNAKYIASSSNDEKVFIYENTFKNKIGESCFHNNRVRKIRFSPLYDDIIFCADDDAKIFVWNISKNTHHVLGTKKFRHKKPIWDFVFVNNGKNIVSVSDDRTIRLWDIENNTSEILYTYDNSIKSIAYDGSDTIFCGCDDGVIIQYCIREKKILKHCKHSKTVWGLDYNNKIDRLLSCSSDGKVLIWSYELNQRLCIEKIIIAHQNVIWSAHFNNKGTLFVTSGEDNEFKVWSVETYLPLYSVKGHTNLLRTIAVSDESNTIIVGGDDSVIREYNQEDRKIQYRYKAHRNRVRHLDWSQDGKCFISVSDDMSLIIWDKLTRNHKEYFGHEKRVWGAAFLNENKFASVGEENNVYLWEKDNPAPQKKLKGHTNWIWDITYCSSKRIFATASEDGTCILWDADTLKKHKLQDHLKWLFAVAFSPSGNKLITTSADKTACIYNVDNKTMFCKLPEHAGWIWSAVFLSEYIVVTGSQDSIIRVWQLFEDGRCELIRRLDRHESWVVALDYSKKNNVFYSASADQTVKIWNAETYEYLGDLHIDKPYDNISIDSIEGLTNAEILSLIQLGANQRINN